MFERTPLLLEQILTEADERIERLRRKAAQGDSEAHERYERELIRAGRHEEYIEPYRRKFVGALNSHLKFLNSPGRGNFARQDDALRKAHHQASHEFHKAAAKTNTPAGQFLRPGEHKANFARDDLSPEETHLRLLTVLHGSGMALPANGIYGVPHEHAENFAASVKHHHPEHEIKSARGLDGWNHFTWSRIRPKPAEASQ